MQSMTTKTAASMARVFASFFSPSCTLVAAGALFAAGAGAAASSLSAARAQPLNYPETLRSDHVDRYGEVEIEDPYRWLEDVDSEQSIQWIDAQDRLTRSLLDGEDRRAIRDRIAELSTFKRDFGFLESKQSLFFRRYTSSPATASLWARDRETGDERQLLAQPYGVAAAADETILFAGLFAEDSGRRLVYLISRNNAPWLEARLLDVATGEIRTPAITGLHRRSASFLWDPAGDSFYYVAFQRGAADAAGNLRPARPAIRRHQLGAPPSEDALIIEFTEDNLAIVPKLSDDGKWMVIEKTDPNDNTIIEIEIADMHADDLRFAAPFADRPGLYSFIEAVGDTLYFYTTHEAPNGRIIKIEPRQSGFAIGEVIPESDEPINANIFFGQGQLGLFGGRLVANYLSEGEQTLRIFDLNGSLVSEVSMGPGVLFGTLTGDVERDEFIAPYTSATSPGSARWIRAATGESRPLASADLPFNPEDFVTTRITYESEPGVTVPMYIVHKRGLKRDGTNPVYIYAYGAWGWLSQPWYQAHIMHMLENGAIYAQPGIRGGGEFGAEWEAAGSRRNKPNTIHDYIAAIEALIERGYTRPELVVANGGSASGNLPAIAAIMRPDLIGGAVIDIPVLDMLRFTEFDSGDQWVGAFGSPADAGDFEILRSYSPLHNLEKGACLPPMIVMAGAQDRSATPIHAYKFAAAAQYAQACAGNPILLNVMEEAGHNFGVTTDQVIEARTDQALFAQRIWAQSIWRRHARDRP